MDTTLIILAPRRKEKPFRPLSCLCARLIGLVFCSNVQTSAASIRWSVCLATVCRDSGFHSRYYEYCSHNPHGNKVNPVNPWQRPEEVLGSSDDVVCLLAGQRPVQEHMVHRGDQNSQKPCTDSQTYLFAVHPPVSPFLWRTLRG
jgi:hypothetical protein